MTTSEQTPIKHKKCDNCGEELMGLFCWVCGQKDSHYNRSVFKVIADFCKEMFDVDSRVFTTLSTLFLRPGALSIQFRDNKRASYVTPIRLYLFSSLVFFFLIAITSQSQNVQLGDQNAKGSTDASPSLNDLGHGAIRSRTGDEIDEYLGSIRELVGFEEDVFESAKNVLTGKIVTLDHDQWSERIFAITDALEDLVGLELVDHRLIEEIKYAEEAHKRIRVLHEFFKSDPMTRAMGEEIVQTTRQGELLSGMKELLSNLYTFHQHDSFEDIKQFEKSLLRLFIHSVYNGKEFLEDMTENSPLMMFALLPIFVGLLALLSVGKGIRIVFQLIFAMHIHALAFITLTIAVLLSLLFMSFGIPIVGDVLFLLIALFLLVHVYLSFKNFYSVGHVISFLKFTVLIFVYLGILSASLLAMAIYFVVAPAL